MTVSHIELIRSAQNNLCAICGGELKEHDRYHERWGWSIEHVYPRASGRYLDQGNKLVTHRRCNQRKGCISPEPELLAILDAVNWKLGWELTPKSPTHDWDNDLSRPTLRIAFEEAMQRSAACVIRKQPSRTYQETVRAISDTVDRINARHFHGTRRTADNDA